MKVQAWYLLSCALHYFLPTHPIKTQMKEIIADIFYFSFSWQKQKTKKKDWHKPNKNMEEGEAVLLLFFQNGLQQDTSETITRIILSVECPLTAPMTSHTNQKQPLKKM